MMHNVRVQVFFFKKKKKERKDKTRQEKKDGKRTLGTSDLCILTL